MRVPRSSKIWGRATPLCWGFEFERSRRVFHILFMRQYWTAHAPLTLPCDLPDALARQQAARSLEITMRESVQLRWIEQAEARSVREYAGLYRVPSEPGPSIAFAEARTSWSSRYWRSNQTFTRAM